MLKVSGVLSLALSLFMCVGAWAESPSPSPSSGVTVLSGNVLDPAAACGSIFSNLPPKFVAGTLNAGGCLLPLSEYCANVTDRVPNSDPKMSALDMNCNYRAWEQNPDGWQCILGATCLSYIVSFTCLSPDDGATPDQKRSQSFDRSTRCGSVMDQAKQICQTACTNGAYNVRDCNVIVTY